MTCLAFVGKVLSFSLEKIRNTSRSGVNDFSAPFAAAKRPLNIGRNALAFRSDSFQFLPAAVKLRNIFSGSSELRIKHLPMLAVLGVEIRVGKLRFEADDIFLRSQDLVFDRF